MKYPRLFENTQIGNVKLKNRIIMAPMGNNFASNSGELSKLQICHYEKRAKGGVGLIITESSPVDVLGMHGKNRIQIYRDEAVKELSVLTERIHQYNAKIALQLTHGGRKCSPDFIGEYPLAPSSIPIVNKDFMPRSISVEEIKMIIEKFAEGAKKAKDANFDGIVLLSASGHLIHQFLSDTTNRRTDEYGGTLENRMRFLIEIIDHIKKVTGDELPISVKLVGKEPGYSDETQITDEEYIKIAKEIVGHGVSLLHLSSNLAYKPDFELMKLKTLARKIKNEVDVKISIAGGIDSPEVGEQLLQDGQVDFIELGRALLSDPEFCNKALAEKPDEIRPCLNCNYCRYRTSQKKPIQCTVNPFLGKLDIKKEAKANKSKPIIIIGGGPAGLQAAISLSAMGYSGKIFEKNSKLGGLLYAAAMPPGKQRIYKYIDYLIDQTKKSNFEIMLNENINNNLVDIIEKESPSAVVAAFGAKPYIPDYADIDNSNIFEATDVLLGNVPLKGKKIVILGAGQVACETADYLSQLNPSFNITVLCGSNKIAKNVKDIERKPLLTSLGEKNIKMIVNASPLTIKEKFIVYDHNGTENSIEYDAVIIAKGWRSDNTLVEALKKKFTNNLFVIGDALSARSILEAVEEASNIAELLN